MCTVHGSACVYTCMCMWSHVHRWTCHKECVEVRRQLTGLIFTMCVLLEIRSPGAFLLRYHKGLSLDSYFLRHFKSWALMVFRIRVPILFIHYFISDWFVIYLYLICNIVLLLKGFEIKWLCDCGEKSVLNNCLLNEWLKQNTASEYL